MASYKPKFKEKAIRTGGLPDEKIKAGGIVFTFRMVYRLKSDAEEAKKFYRSINSQVRIVRKDGNYWVYAGRR